MEGKPSISNLNTLNVVSLFVNKNLKYSFSKCVLIYGKRVKDSKGNSIAKAGDKGAKSGKVCPNDRELVRNYCFELWQKQLELNFGESIKIVQG